MSCKIVTEKTIVLPPTSPGNGGHAQYRLSVVVPKRRYLAYLRERWWVVLACLAVAVGGAITYATLRPETYDSYAQLYLTMGPQIGTSLFGETKDDYATQIELLKGNHLQSAAMADLGPAASSLKKPIKVEVVRPMGASILQLRATGSDPALPQQFLQALIKEYLAFKNDTRLSTTEDLLKILTDERSKSETDLRTEQDKWDAFQKTNNVALLEEEAKSAGTFLADQNVQLANLMLEQELLRQGIALAAPVWSTNASTTNLTDSPGSGGAKTNSNFATLATTDATLKSARFDLMMTQAQLAKVLTNGPAYRVKPLKDQMAQMEQNVAMLEEIDAAQRKADLEEIEARIAAISNAIPIWEANVSDSGNRLSESEGLKADIQRQQGYYDRLLALLQNVDLTKNMQEERVTVLDAPSPGQPAQSSLTSLVFMAVVLGLAVSLGIVFLWHLFDDRFVSVSDIKDQFGEAILGLVPRIKIPRARPKAALLQESDPRQAYWESYRHLRSALLLSELGESRPHTILFTSAMPEEGKTTVAVNLATMLARSGLRVALVDADPHGGGVHQFVGKQGQSGLLDYLRGEAGIKTIVEAAEIPGLSIIGAGTHREHAEGLLLRPEMAALLAEVRKSNDYVILDGAPVLAADDAALLVPYTDAVVLVVRPFFSRSRMVRQTLEMLYQRQAKQIAIVFNQARPDDLAGQKYYARNGAGRPAPAAPLKS